MQVRAEPLKSGCPGSKPGSATYSVRVYLLYAFISSQENEDNNMSMLSGCSEVMKYLK